MIRRAELRAGLVAAGLLLAVALPAGAQSVRITGVTTARYVGLRELVTDSIPVEQAVGSGTLRESPSGVRVRCIAGEEVCRFERTGGDVGSFPLVQDLHVNAWGFGEGIRVHAHLRARDALGGEIVWPRSEDHFDALVAYAELLRPSYRVRAGRLRQVSGLGYYNFDGAEVTVRPRPELTVEAFGGWSLARGLAEPRTGDALEAVESFAPDERALIFGGEVRYRNPRWGGVGALYQREIRGDRAGLYSERVAADGRVRIDDVSLTGALEVDLGAGDVNEGRIEARKPLGGGVGLSVEYRHYRPFFELWTIWGAFDPVGYDEGLAGLWWSMPDRRLSLALRAGVRSYPETNAGLSFAPFRDDGWRVAADGSWRAGEGWRVRGGYRRDVGFGMGSSEGDVRVEKAFDEQGSVGVHLSAFQSAGEFRVTQGTVVGIGVDGGFRVSSTTRIDGGFSTYHHDTDARASGKVDWDQARAFLRLRWTVGPDPGLAARTGRDR